MNENVLYFEEEKEILWVVPFHDFIAEKREDTGSKSYKDWFPDDWSWLTVLWECLESDLCNGYFLLTSMDENFPLMADTIVVEDPDGRLWYDAGYASSDLLEETLTKRQKYPLYPVPQ